MEIKALTPELTADFLQFFDHDAFSDNKDWEDCYCLFYHFAVDAEWQVRTKGMNRETAIEYIANGTLNGYLAYEDGKVVGWCNANDREAFPRLVREPGFMTFREGSGRGKSIVCYLIAPAYRGKGVASALLDRVIDDARSNGCQFVEAYPVKGVSGCAHLYHGPLSMYQKKGFEIVLTVENLDVVRLDL